VLLFSCCFSYDAHAAAIGRPVNFPHMPGQKQALKGRFRPTDTWASPREQQLDAAVTMSSLAGRTAVPLAAAEPLAEPMQRPPFSSSPSAFLAPEEPASPSTVAPAPFAEC